MSVVEIRYNGSDITPDVILASARFTALVSGGIGNFTFKVRDDGHTYEFISGGEITLDIDSQRVWGGFVTKAQRVYPFPVIDTTNPPAANRYWELAGVDYNVLFTKRIVFDALDPAGKISFDYPVGTFDDTIINDIFDNYLDLSGDGLSRSGVTRVDVVTLDIPGVTSGKGTLTKGRGQVASAGYTWKQAMDVIARATGAVYYIDPTKVLHYVDVDTADASRAISDQPSGTDVGLQNFSILNSASNMINDMLVWGSAAGVDRIVFSRAQDSASLAAHNRWQHALFSGGLYKQASANLVASSYLNGTPQSKRGAKDDAISVMCRVFEPGFGVGQKVDTTVAIFGYNDVLPIRRMEIRFVNPAEATYDLILSHEIDQPWSIFEMYFPGFAFDFKPPSFYIPPFVLPGLGDPGGLCDEETTCADGIADDFNRPDTTAGPNTTFGLASCGVPWRTGVATGEANTTSAPSGNISGGTAHVQVASTVIGVQVANRHVLPIEEMSLPEGVARRVMRGTIEFFSDKDATDLSGNQLFYPVVVMMSGTPTGTPNGGHIRIRQAGPTASTPGTSIYFATGSTTTNQFFAAPITVVKNTWYTLRFEIEEDRVMRAKVWMLGDPEPGTWVSSTIVSNQLNRFEGIQIGAQTSSTTVTSQCYFRNLRVDGISRCSQTFSDNLQRTSSGWGSMDIGYIWQTIAGAPTVNLQGGGVLNASTPNKVQVDVNSVDTEAPWMQPGGWDFRTRIRPSTLGNSAGNYVELDIMHEDPLGGDHARLRIRAATSAGPGELFVDCTGFTPTAVTKNWVGGDDYFLRWEFHPGTVNRVKLWSSAELEPGTWNIDLMPSGTQADPTAMSRLYLAASRTAALGAGIAWGVRFLDWAYNMNPCYRIVGGGLNCPNSDFDLGTYGAGTNNGETTDHIPAEGDGQFHFNADTSDDEYTWVIMLALNSPGVTVITDMTSLGWNSHPGNGFGTTNGRVYIWWAPADQNYNFSIVFSANSVYDYFVTAVKNPTSIDTQTNTGSGTLVTGGAFPKPTGQHFAARGFGITDNSSAVASGGMSSIVMTPLYQGRRLFGSVTREYPYQYNLDYEIVGTLSASAFWVFLSIGFYQERDCTGAVVYRSSPQAAIPNVGNVCENAVRIDATTYQVSKAMIAGSSQVTKNGLFQRPGIAREYTESTAATGTIVFNDPVDEADVIYVCYVANGEL